LAGGALQKQVHGKYPCICEKVSITAQKGILLWNGLTGLVSAYYHVIRSDNRGSIHGQDADTTD